MVSLRFSGNFTADFVGVSSRGFNFAVSASFRSSSSKMRSSNLLCSTSDLSYACLQNETLSKNLSGDWNASAVFEGLIDSRVCNMYSDELISCRVYQRIRRQDRDL